MVGAHTDSCTLRIKPVSKKTSAGFIQVGVETYGGGKWHTWFDRDLSVAGRVMVKDGKGGFAQKLVMVERPILRIPTLAIHLDREKSFDPNTETELFPIAGLVAAELNRMGENGEGKKADGKEAKHADGASGEPFQPLQAATDRHHPYVVQIIAEHAGVDVEDVVDFEMVLYDTQKACIGGINNELIFAARLDNLGMTHSAVEGLISSVASPTALDNDSTIRLISCFDHEEIGSASAQGARSNFLPAVLRRLSVLPATQGDSKQARELQDTSTAYEQTLSTSFLVSADMAHSVNPNYAHKYEADHRPEMNKGTVIKINANQRYMSNSPGIVLLQEVARLAKPSSSSTASVGVPLQLFVVRNDSSCGSTIGPMIASSLGTRTIDVGNAQLSMHSIRETAGVYDVEHATRLFSSFFEHYGELESKIIVD
jgi:aspartyl aminopeptidase